MPDSGEFSCLKTPLKLREVFSSRWKCSFPLLKVGMDMAGNDGNPGEFLGRREAQPLWPRVSAGVVTPGVTQVAEQNLVSRQVMGILRCSGAAPECGQRLSVLGVRCNPGQGFNSEAQFSTWNPWWVFYCIYLRLSFHMETGLYRHFFIW